MNGGELWLSKFCVSWLCVLQPALMLGVGAFFGRHGLRGGIFRIWVGIGGGR